MSQKNKDLVRSAVEGIWNHGKLDVVDTVVDANYIAHMPGGQDVKGIQGLKDAVANFRKAFPNVRMKIESQVAEGDEVVTTMVMEGKQDGALKTSKGEVKPTGKPVQARGISRMRIKGDKIVEEWVSWDEHATLEQVGAADAKIAY